MTENVNSLKKKAHALVQKGRYDSALKIFNLVIENDPEDASVHNKIGDILLKLKDEEKAKEHFLLSADLYEAEGLSMVALSVCRKIRRSFPTEIKVNLLMGKCYEDQKKTDQAKIEYIEYLKGKPPLTSPEVARVLRALIILDPDTEKWVSNLAKVAYKQKNEAFLDYAVSISMERNQPDHQKIANMFKKLQSELHPKPKPKPKPKLKSKTKAKQKTQEQFEEIPVIEEIEEENMDTASLLDSLSFDDEDILVTSVLDEISTTNDSVEHNSEIESNDIVEDIEPSDIKNNLDFDKADSENGTSESSDDVLNDIALDDGEDWSIEDVQMLRPQRIGEYFVASGLLKASDVLRALDRQSSSDEDSRLGDVLVDMNLVSSRQVREALSKQVADMRGRLEKEPDDALGFIEMANLLLDVGDFYGAVSAYLRAAEIYRNDQRDYMVFELLEGVLDICPESLSAAKEIVRIRHTIDKEGQARAFYRLAVAYLLNDSSYEAIASLEAAVDVQPDYADAIDLMNGLRPDSEHESRITGVADILDDIDSMNTDSSKSALADIILEFKTGIDSSISKEDYSTHFDLGIAYREMGLLREAIQEFEKVLISPDYRIRAREMLGRCTFDMKRYDEAEDHFKKGLVLASSQDEKIAIVGFHVNLYKVYDYTGRNGHAEAEMQIATDLDPVMAKVLQLE